MFPSAPPQWAWSIARVENEVNEDSFIAHKHQNCYWTWLLHVYDILRQSMSKCIVHMVDKKNYRRLKANITVLLTIHKSN